MRRKARIGIERRVDGIMSEMEKERFARINRRLKRGIGFDGEGFCQEGFSAVVFLKAGHGVKGAFAAATVVLLSKIAAGRAERGTGDVAVEADFRGIGPVEFARREVPLADVNGAVASRAEETGQSRVARLKALPGLVRRTLGSRIVVFRIDPVGRSVASGVLPGEDGDAGR